MTRGLPSDIAISVGQPTFKPLFAVELLFDSPNELRFWTGIGDLTYDGETYTGAGTLMQISDIEESSDVAATGATLTLSGIPTDLLSLALDENYQGRFARIKFGVITEARDSGFLLISDTDYLLIDDAGGRLDISHDSNTEMFDLFVGRMDVMTIDEGADTATISMTVENKMIDLERARVRRYSDASQRSRYPDDRAFEFVTRLQDESLTWGS